MQINPQALEAAKKVFYSDRDIVAYLQSLPSAYGELNAIQHFDHCHSILSGGADDSLTHQIFMSQQEKIELYGKSAFRLSERQLRCWERKWALTRKIGQTR